MIYLIGGAARAGKTILTQRLWKDHSVPYFCVDYFVSGIQEGAPQLGIFGESPTITRAERLWLLIVGMLRNVAEVEPEYTVEGDALWPSGVAELRKEYPGLVRTCFVGYADTTPERKLTEIRNFPGGVNDWVQHHTDEYVLDLVKEMIEVSKFLEEECARVAIPYVDVSADFLGGLERAYKILSGA